MKTREAATERGIVVDPQHHEQRDHESGHRIVRLARGSVSHAMNNHLIRLWVLLLLDE